MIGVLRERRRAVVAALLCVTSLAALPAHSVATPSAKGLPAGCGPKPSWIDSAALARDGQLQLSSCFAPDSSQAETLVSVASNRPYAQLITIAGGQLDPLESSLSSPLETALARLLASSPSPSGPQALLLGPGARATLAISRPAPGAVQVVHIDPAPDNAFAVAALSFRLLSAAAKHRSVSAATQSCIAVAVYGALSIPPHPERALRQIHACVNAADPPTNAGKLLRGLADSLLRGPSFEQVIKREGAEPHPARIAFTISASNPNLVNPSIHLGSANLGTVTSGELTVKHLTASGGAPPYRFYIVSEPGGPEVPPWLHLAADGTLTIEPPAGATSVNLTVKVVDSNGEHSVVPY